MAKKPTLNALARAAKVSPATVSRVVGGSPTVAPEIRAHVPKTAEKLGIDLEERRKGRSRIIAFLLANRDMLHNFQARILLGAEAYRSQHHWEFQRCEQGCLRAMTEAGLAPASFDFRSDGAQLGYLAAKSLFMRGAGITGVVAGSDQVAAGVYSALRELGLLVPDDVSVVGINDTQGALLAPELTSVREFPEELGPAPRGIRPAPPADPAPPLPANDDPHADRAPRVRRDAAGSGARGRRDSRRPAARRLK